VGQLKVTKTSRTKNPTGSENRPSKKEERKNHSRDNAQAPKNKRKFPRVKKEARQGSQGKKLKKKERRTPAKDGLPKAFKRCNKKDLKKQLLEGGVRKGRPQRLGTESIGEKAIQ